MVTKHSAQKSPVQELTDYIDNLKDGGIKAQRDFISTGSIDFDRSLRHYVDWKHVVDMLKSVVRSGWSMPPVIIVRSDTLLRALDGHHRITTALLLKGTIQLPQKLDAWIVEEKDYAELITRDFNGKEPEKIDSVRNKIWCDNLLASEVQNFSDGKLTLNLSDSQKLQISDWAVNIAERLHEMRQPTFENIIVHGYQYSCRRCLHSS